MCSNKREEQRIPSIRPFVARRVPLANGATIATTSWPGTRGPLVCVHGLTSSSRAFAGLATELLDFQIVAVDCRGRGGSTKAPPYGMEQHAEDLRSVMDTLEIRKATLIGHSMGCYVLGAFAAKYPERVDSLAFIDGGYLNVLRPGVVPEVLLEQMLGGFLQKLRRSWSSFDEYIGFFETSTLYPDGVDAYGRAHFEYDLEGEAPALKAKTVEACVVPDWRELLDSTSVRSRLCRVQAPLLLVRAPGGLTGVGDEVISASVRDVIIDCVPETRVVDVPGTNHHTVLLSIKGARDVASALREFLK